MRLWTLHPRYLDVKGLVAAWREALLAQKVLAGATIGYRRHPQLARFEAEADPLAAIGVFLTGIAADAQRRGYRFDVTRISRANCEARISETHGQLLFEWAHLQNKLRARSPEICRKLRSIRVPDSHPLFTIIPGDVKSWERR